jgi:hypothetical protein
MSALPGCNASLMDFERTFLGWTYCVTFFILPFHGLVMAAGVYWLAGLHKR